MAIYSSTKALYICVHAYISIYFRRSGAEYKHKQYKHRYTDCGIRETIPFRGQIKKHPIIGSIQHCTSHQQDRQQYVGEDCSEVHNLCREPTR